MLPVAVVSVALSKFFVPERLVVWLLPAVVLAVTEIFPLTVLMVVSWILKSWLAEEVSRETWMLTPPVPVVSSLELLAPLAPVMVSPLSAPTVMLPLPVVVTVELSMVTRPSVALSTRLPVVLMLAAVSAKRSLLVALNVAA